MSARDEAAGGVELKPCERCGIVPSKPFENLMDNPDDPDEDPVPVWTIQHQCAVTQNDVWVTANNPADCARRWNPAPSPRDQASSAMLGALEKIRRTPSRPFPDPGAHSERAFGDAVHRAWREIQSIATEASSSARSAGIEPLALPVGGKVMT